MFAVKERFTGAPVRPFSRGARLRKRPLVIVTRKLPDAIETRMCELFDTELNLEDERFGRERMADVLARADVLVPTINDPLDADMIEKAGAQLKMIAAFGNGVDNIDVAAAQKRGITVTNTPRVLTDDTADMIMAMILALPRRLVEGANLLADGGEWEGWSPTWMLGRRVTGKRLGIVGMGRIGAAVARRARAFGMAIHYHNRNRVHAALADELEATYWASLDQMLSRMDIISINCPSTPATFHMLSRRRLELVQRGAYIINAARGEIIDEEALVDALESRAIRGAALDVFVSEPAVNPKLVELAREGRVLLLPHISSATQEGRTEMGEKVIVNIRAFMDGHRPPDRVLPEVSVAAQ